ncbi:VanZ family protein [Flavobacterium sp. LC2016-12]|uniref:VanZ family protein n=1 Tax=Flavobacterium sp. LC2016-12 TaxID=2783794 RepID=UPI00188A437E|nr:VanZ family protein [Flavobacterium sp. LC2016-12]MBF4464345.1 VanZ family protein [Flavobacterium sp. LC2016-12]
MVHKILLMILLLIIAVVFYFSWLPDPSLKSESYLPNWLLKWSNHYYNLRTAIPFIAVGFLLEAYTKYKNSNELNPAKNFNFIQNIGIAAIIVCIAEGGQFLIHKRSPDLMDVLYGIIGSVIGAVGYNLFKKNQKCETDINLRS